VSETAAPTTPATVAEPEVSTAELERQVWDELRQCFDPELPVNVVDLGLIYAVRSEPLPAGGHRVEVLMTVTAPACGMSEILRTEAEERIVKLPGVLEVAVAITFDPPWTPELMSEDARALLNL
jgi:metal-sulfur cluster biosynthetic enzyme